MISKLPYEKNSQENSQIMFQVCVLNQKVQGKELTLCSWIFFNAMIRNIKTNNILNIIEIPKSMEPNKYTH
jgi:hypothetical protein